MKIDYAYMQQTVFSSTASSSGSNEEGSSTAAFENLLAQSYHCSYCNSNEEIPVSGDTENTTSGEDTYKNLANVMQQVQESVDSLMARVEDQLSFALPGVVGLGGGDDYRFLPDSVSNDMMQAVSDALEKVQENGDSPRQLLTVTTVVAFEFTASFSQGGVSSLQTVDGSIDDFLSGSIIQDVSEEYGAFFRQNSQYAEYANTMEQFFAQFSIQWEEMGLGAKPAEEEHDPTVQAFLDKLREKGAYVSLVEMNQEKIDKLIQERREKLGEQYGLNCKPPLPPEEQTEIRAKIEDELQQYRKELTERFRAVNNEEAPNRHVIPTENLGSLLQTV